MQVVLARSPRRASRPGRTKLLTQLFGGDRRASGRPTRTSRASARRATSATSTNHGCSMLVWFGTRSSRIRMPRAVGLGDQLVEVGAASRAPGRRRSSRRRRSPSRRSATGTSGDSQIASMPSHCEVVEVRDDPARGHRSRRRSSRRTSAGRSGSRPRASHQLAHAHLPTNVHVVNRAGATAWASSERRRGAGTLRRSGERSGERREWDSNPRRLAPQPLSRRSRSAAPAPLRDEARCARRVRSR